MFAQVRVCMCHVVLCLGNDNIYVRVSVDEVHVCPHQPYTDWMDGYLAWF